MGSKSERLRDGITRAAAGRVAYLVSDGEWGYLVQTPDLRVDDVADAVAGAVEALFLMPDRPDWWTYTRLDGTV